MKKILKSVIILMVIFVLFLSGGCSKPYEISLKKSEYGKVEEKPSKTLGESEIYFLNVCSLEDYQGQADSILILDNGTVTLIDAGETTEGTKKTLISFLDELGIKKIDHLILTHAHSDHGGAMEKLIYYYDIGTLYIKKPYDWEIVQSYKEIQELYDNIFQAGNGKVNSDGTYTMINMVEENETEVKLSEKGKLTMYFSENVYSSKTAIDYNHFSMVLKYTYGNASAFLGGDATTETDKEIVSKIGNCQLYKVCHHGSNGPYNSEELIDALKPQEAIVTGLQSHLKDELKEKLSKRNIPVVFTGDGHIKYTCDGENFTKN